MSACSNFIAQVQSIEESDVMSESFNEMEKQFAQEDQTLYERMRSKGRQRGLDNMQPESASRFASRFASGGEDLCNISLDLVEDEEDIAMGRLINLE